MQEAIPSSGHPFGPFGGSISDFCDAQDIDGEDPLKAAIAEPPNFFKA